jgi:YaiO family outer membrane protein
MSLINAAKAAVLALGVYIPAFVLAQQTSPMPSNVSPGAAGVVSPAGAAPQDVQPVAPDQRTMMGIFGTYENLSGTQPNWHDFGVRLNKNFGSRHILDASITQTRRFDLSDTQFSGMYSLPISTKLTGSFGGNLSPTHRVLPKYSLGGTLQYEVARGWLTHGGLKTTEFNNVRVNQGLLMLEHYFSNFSVAVAFRPSRAFGSTANSTELRGGYYYNDQNSVSLSLSEGSEATSVGTGVVLADVQTIAVFGRHWLTRNWSANYAVGHTRQGDFYTRNGVSVGVDYAF